MRRPHRRIHLLTWLFVAAAVAAGAAIAPTYEPSPTADPSGVEAVFEETP